MLAQRGPAEPKGGSCLGQAETQEMTVASSGRWLTAGGGLLVDGCSSSCPQLPARPLFAAGMANTPRSTWLITVVYSLLHQELRALNSSFSHAEEGSLKYSSSCFSRSWVAHAAKVSCWTDSKESFLLKINPRSVEVMLSYEAVTWKCFRLHSSRSSSNLVMQATVRLPFSQASRTKFSKDSKM